MSNEQLSKTHGIRPVRFEDEGAVSVRRQELRAKAAEVGWDFDFAEEPQLVRLPDGGVPGTPGSEGLMWAIPLAKDPEFSGGGPGREYRPTDGATGTYFILFLNAATGEYVMAIGGETFD